jgi:hypothetical protein
VNLSVALNGNKWMKNVILPSNLELSSTDANDSGYADCVPSDVNDGDSERDTKDSMSKVKQEEHVSKPMNDSNLVREFYELKAKYHLYVTLQDLETEVITEQQPQSNAERSSLDWSFVQDVEDAVDEKQCDAVELEMTSSGDEDFLCQPPDTSEQISTNSEAVLTESISGDKESRSMDRFLLWLENSISVQKDLVERALTVSASFDYKWMEDMSDLIEMGGDLGDTVHEMMRKNALKAVANHLNSVREGVKGFKEGVAEPWRDENVGKSL